MRWLLLVALVLMGQSAYGDDARPVLVQITADQNHHHKIVFKIPNNGSLLAHPKLILPNDCVQTQAIAVRHSDSTVYHLDYQCSNSLKGQELAIDYPAINPGLFLLFRYIDQQGQQSSQMLKPDQRQWRVPEEMATAVVMQQYTVLGVEHIWAGWDHLLFIACLILLTAGRWKQLLLTITGFTLAHSVTLVLAALEWVSLPSPPVEAVIALSILFLATEIARQRSDSLTYRYPILVSSSFGLLHGFGFASVLMDVGLPSKDLGIALLGFNLGVEIGQLLFIGATVVGLALCAKLFKRKSFDQQSSKFFYSKGAREGVPFFLVMIYAVGGLSAYWTIERLAVFLP